MDGTPLCSRVDLDSLAQGPGERLEACLDHVVGVGAVARPDVQGQLRVGGDGAEELLRELGVESGDRDRRQVGLEQAQRPPGDVDRAHPERLVHGDRGVPVAADPRAVIQRAVDRLPERDADVLDRVMGTGLQVAGCLHPQPEPPVPAEQLEHVIEEADPGRGRHVSPVEVQRELDLGLASLA